MQGFTVTDFLAHMIAAGNVQGASRANPRACWQHLIDEGIPEKALESHAHTLNSRDHWTWGVDIRAGWVTPEGVAAARELGHPGPPLEPAQPSRPLPRNVITDLRGSSIKIERHGEITKVWIHRVNAMVCLHLSDELIEEIADAITIAPQMQPMPHPTKD